MKKDNTAPLEGIKILDLTRLLPGPLASLYLADLGAEVVKIEDPITGDYMRKISSQPKGENNSFIFQLLNRNKSSCTLNLKEETDRKQFLDLINSSDILFESFRPGVMQKLALSYEELKTINPQIIYCSLTGYGQKGQHSQMAGHDINYLALSGVLEGIGEDPNTPQLASWPIADIAGGSLMALTAILAALFQRSRTKQGTFIDISMTRSMLSLNPTNLGLLSSGVNLTRGENLLNGGHPCYQIYQTKDQKFMALGCLEEKFFDQFCQSVGKPEWIKYHSRPDEFKTLQTLLKNLLATQSRDQWWELLKEVDCCCTPVLTLKESLDWHKKEDRLFQIELPTVDGSSIETWTIPFQFDNWKPQNKQAAPLLGEHNPHYLEGES